jgi:CubicO group peptidase (beta-lactamase class C family)
MKIICLFLASLCLPVQLAAQSAPAAATLPSPEVALRGFDELVEEAMKAGRVPGLAISVVRNGKVVLSKGYGVRNPRTNAPMTKDTLFPVFSVTKAITGFSAGLLVDEGRLSFDAPIRTYIPSFQMHDPVATSELTMRDFLSHRSGFPDHWFVRYGNKSLTREELFKRLPHLPLSAPIRTRYQYSNFGYAVAGHVIEKVAGVPWEQFTEERILKPLGMTRSTMSPARFQADPNHMVGVMFDRDKYVVTPFDPIEPYVTPAGGVYSTAEDFAKWMLVNLSQGRSGEHQIIKSGTLSQLHRTGIPTHWSSSAERIYFGYALGWNTEVYRGEPHLHHDGGSWGVTTVVGLLPRLGLGVTVFANQDQSRVAHGLMRNLLDRFMGVTPGNWVTEELVRQHAWESRQAAAGPGQERPRIMSTQPSRNLAEYAGTYTHPGYGPVTIRLEGERLIADRTGEMAPISHWHYDVFAASSPDPRNLWAPEGNSAFLSFLADPTGKISALQISSAGDIFFKKQPDGEQKPR